MDFQSNIDNYNRTPNKDFDGLSPNQMKDLIYNLFNENCILQTKTDLTMEVLDGTGFFRVCETFMKIVQNAENLKLTAKGNLPQKVIKELHDSQFIKSLVSDKDYKLHYVESNFMYIHNAHLLCKACGLLKKKNNALSLTAYGKKLIQPEKRNELFTVIFDNFIFTFNWAYNDQYPDVMNGRFGIGFTIYLVSKYGRQNLPVKFYVDKYKTAFPTLINEYPTDYYLSQSHLFYNIYKLRAFERFLDWFNLVEIKETGRYSLNEDASVKATHLFYEVFKVVL
jgi:hypothetical protein